MYIRRKVFSLLQDENGEERYFSTTDILMEDEEERLFSLVDDEDLEQKEFARKDYLGLTKEASKFLKSRRDRVAKFIKNKRKSEQALSKYENMPEYLNKENRWLSKTYKEGAKSDAKLYDDYVKKNKGKVKQLLSPEEYLNNL